MVQILGKSNMIGFVRRQKGFHCYLYKFTQRIVRQQAGVMT